MKPNKNYKERRYFSLFLFVCRVRRRGGAGEKKFGFVPIFRCVNDMPVLFRRRLQVQLWKCGV